MFTFSLYNLSEILVGICGRQKVRGIYYEEIPLHALTTGVFII